MKKHIKVVGAIILNDCNEVLCALRSTKMSLSNLWEFPGGKIESGESLTEALTREIYEELNCKIECYDIFNNNTHEYDNFTVNLITIKCRLLSGTPIAKEHAKLMWLNIENLKSLNWAPADIPAVNQLIDDLNK